MLSKCKYVINDPMTGISLLCGCRIDAKRHRSATSFVLAIPNIARLIGQVVAEHSR